MALPIIKAKSYNYGSYANPQQVKFRAGIGTQIGEQFGAGLAQGMQEKRAEKKEQEKLDKLKEAQDTRDRLAAENKLVDELAQPYYEVYGKENAYSFGELVRDNVIYDEDSIDMKFQKKINKESLLNAGTLLNQLDNDGIDYSDPNTLDSLSKEDLQNASDKHKLKSGAVIVRTDKSTNPPKAKFILPEFDWSKSVIDANAVTEREVDIMAIFNHKLTPKYNDNVLADEKYMLANEDSLKKIPLKHVKQEKKMMDGINGRIYEVIDTDRLFEDPDINFTPGINAIINDYGKSIWVDEMNNQTGSYTGSDEQKNEIRKKLREDLKDKIGGFRLSSTKYTVPEGEEDEEVIVSDKDIIGLADKVNDYFQFPIHEYGGKIDELEGQLFTGGVGSGRAFIEETFISDKPHPETGKIGLTIEYRDEEFDDKFYNDDSRMVKAGIKTGDDYLTKFVTYPLNSTGKRNLLKQTNYLNTTGFEGKNAKSTSARARVDAELNK